MVERFERRTACGVNLTIVDAAESLLSGEASGKRSSAFAEHEQVGKRVAAQPVRAVQTRTALASRKQARYRRHLGLRVDQDSTHYVVGCWPDLHRFLCDIDIGELFELMI